MSYSTTEDLLKEFSAADLGRLTGTHDEAAYDGVKIENAREAADSLIDSFLEGRYGLPFAAVPSLILKISVDLTVANLYDTVYKSSSLPNTIIWRRRSALKLLQQLQSGDILLPGYARSEASGKIITNKSDTDRIFNNSVMEIFKQSRSCYE